jgi:hypothetical protein
MDLLIILCLIIAAILGASRTCKKSLAYFLVHLASIAGSALIGGISAPFLSNSIFTRVNFARFLPSGFAQVMEPQMISFVTKILFLLIFIICFILFKCFLCAFCRNYQWWDLILPKFKLPFALDRVISSTVTTLNAYTCIIGALMVLAFPFLNVLAEDTLPDRILEGAPFSRQLDAIFEPYVRIREQLDLLEQEEGEFQSRLEDARQGELNIEYWMGILERNPERAADVKEMLIEIFPELPEDFVAYLDQFIRQ